MSAQEYLDKIAAIDPDSPNYWEYCHELINQFYHMTSKEASSFLTQVAELLQGQEKFE